MCIKKERNCNINKKGKQLKGLLLKLLFALARLVLNSIKVLNSSHLINKGNLTNGCSYFNLKLKIKELMKRDNQLTNRNDNL